MALSLLYTSVTLLFWYPFINLILSHPTSPLDLFIKGSPKSALASRAQTSDASSSFFSLDSGFELPAYLSHVNVNKLKKCPRQGSNVIVATTTAVKCPCYARYRVLPSSSTPEQKYDFLLMTEDAFARYEKSGFTGTPDFVKKYSSLGQGVRKSRRKSKGYIRSSSSFDIQSTETYRLVVRSSRSSSLCSASASYVFEGQPLACPTKLSTRQLVATNIESGAGDLMSTQRVVGGIDVATDTSVSKKTRSEVVGASAYIILKSGGFCTGALISPSFVLTAAHCDVAEMERVRVGGSNAVSGVSYEITNSYAHPEYSDKQFPFLNDIALIQIDRPVRNATPFMLNTGQEMTKDGKFLRAMGYGALSEGFVGPRPVSLKRVDVPVIGFDTCAGLPAYDKLDDSLQICAGYKKGGCNSCHGDSGGPLYYLNNARATTAGVVLGAKGCARSRHPSVYTRVAAYISWIKPKVVASGETIITCDGATARCG